jgi:hypothetical protein
VVYYPAAAGTGRGHVRYLDPALAGVIGLRPGGTERVVSSAEVDAEPAPTSTPRPLVLLSPGWRFLAAFLTFMAEDLASHGYVVVATQTDVATEARHHNVTAEDRAKRSALLERVLDFVSGPALPALVGPIDRGRIAAGGHSFAGSIAFDASLADRRIAAVFDLDGSVLGAASRTPVRRPALVVVTIDHGLISDPLLARLGSASRSVVSVGLSPALHLDLTDVGSIPSMVTGSLYAPLVSVLGPRGTVAAATILRRFLDAALALIPRTPTASELVEGLWATTADPFGKG